MENEIDGLLKKANSLMKDYVYENGIMKPLIKYVNKSNNSDPEYALDGDSGFDLRAYITNENKSLSIAPGEHLLIKTGLHYQIPSGLEMQIRPRSGLGSKGIMVHWGTIDSNYRGDVGIIIYNFNYNENGTKIPFVINNGDRIAQAVISQVQTKTTMKLMKVNDLEESNRNSGGFGHTGI